MKLALKAPHVVYRNAAGQRRPGVTTVLGSLAKPQLYRWYAAMERDACDRGLPIPPPNDKGEPVYFAELKRDKAADLGTIVHARIEAWLRGEELEPDDLPPDLYEQSVHGFDRFRQWWTDNNFGLVASELGKDGRSLVSEEMQVGGTMDVAATNMSCTGSKGIVVVDIKSSKANPGWPFKEMKSQAQTYGRIWTELNHAPVHEVWLYRCGTTEKDPGQEHQLSDKERDAGNRLFDGALLAYEAARDLE